MTPYIKSYKDNFYAELISKLALVRAKNTYAEVL